MVLCFSLFKMIANVFLFFCEWFPLVVAFRERWHWCGGGFMLFMWGKDVNFLSSSSQLSLLMILYLVQLLRIWITSSCWIPKKIKPSCHTFLHHFALTRVTNMTKSFWDAINMKYEWCSSSVPINHLLFVDAGFQIIRWMQNAAFHNPSRPFSLLISMLVLYGIVGRVSAPPWVLSTACDAILNG